MSKYNFVSPKQDEEIVLVVRQHPWFFFVPILYIMSLIAICVVVYLKAGAGPIISWTTVVSAVLSTYILIRYWYIWYNQTYIITTDRIMAVDQRGWFTHSISEAVLENVLFINHVVKGPIKSMLDFGDVHIRASGVTEDELVFYNVANPYEIQQLIVSSQRKKINLKDSQEKNHEVKSQPIIR
jgi:hypothetical protein